MQPVEHISRSSSGGFGPVPGIVVGLVGAASLGIGYGYFGTQASSAASKVKAGTDPASNRSKAKDDALIADVCGGVGGALMATGIILAIVGATSGSSSTADAAPVTTSVAITPSGASIALSGSF